MSLSPLALVNVSCISAAKPSSLPIQLGWPTIVKLPSLLILPMWVALPVPAVVAVLRLVNVIVPSSPSRDGRFCDALAVITFSASVVTSGRIVEFLELVNGVMVLLVFHFPAELCLRNCGSGRDEETQRGKALRLIRIRKRSFT